MSPVPDHDLVEMVVGGARIPELAGYPLLDPEDIYYLDDDDRISVDENYLVARRRAFDVEAAQPMSPRRKFFLVIIIVFLTILIGLFLQLTHMYVLRDIASKKAAALH